MKKIIMIVLAATLVLSTASVAYAHSGRTDKHGCHQCSAKSKKKGLCRSYHCHH